MVGDKRNAPTAASSSRRQPRFWVPGTFDDLDAFLGFPFVCEVPPLRSGTTRYTIENKTANARFKSVLVTVLLFDLERATNLALLPRREGSRLRRHRVNFRRPGVDGEAAIVVRRRVDGGGAVARQGVDVL